MNPFKHMKVLYRLLCMTLGFMAVMAAIVYVGWRGLEGVGREMETYASWADAESSMDKSVTENVLALESATLAYRLDPAETTYNSFKIRLAAARTGYTSWARSMKDHPDLLETAGAVPKQLDAMAGAVDAFQEMVKRRDEILEEVDTLVAGVGQRQQEAAEVMIRPGLERAGREGDLEAYRHWSALADGLNRQVIVPGVLLQAAFHQYARTPNDEAKAALDKAMATAKQELAAWGSAAQDDTALATLADDVDATYEAMEEHLGEVSEAAQKLRRSGSQIKVAAAQILSATSMVMEGSISPAKLNAQNSARKVREDTAATLAAVGLGALALSTLFALLYALYEVRVLRRLTAFAERVARGDLDTDAVLRTRDEFGQLSQALAHAAETIRTVTARFGATVATVRKGHLLTEADPEGLDGAYRDLILGANQLTGALTGFFDAVPTPVMIRDAERSILYINKAGADLGERAPLELLGTKCSDLFCTSDCTNGRCAVDRSLQSGESDGSQTDAHPGGLDLEISYSAVPILDEDGQPVAALEVVVDHTEIRRAQQRMLGVAERADAISQRLSSASEELAAQVEQIAKGAMVQRDRIHETVTAMEEMTATVNEVASSASNASSLSGTARQEAATGSDVVDKAVAAISQVHEAAMDLQGAMTDMGHQADSIGKVMGVIGDIADQTNLLALNAAIEAARAGEAGRGFAVVADEVRKLAEKTVDATQEVGNLISAIQQASERNMHSMRRAVEAVDQATELAGQSGQALERIVGFVGENADQVAGIATAAEEQSAASEEINASLGEVNRIVSDTTEGMEQSARAVQELADMSAELAELIGELTDGQDHDADAARNGAHGNGANGNGAEDGETD
ncbi:MAG: PAS domain-containing protein [Desulfovibrionaceae bacterium]|nr:PAS domain-containing protein [Desulfovibrionaceae bacterium]